MINYEELMTNQFFFSSNHAIADLWLDFCAIRIAGIALVIELIALQVLLFLWTIVRVDWNVEQLICRLQV